MQISVGTDIIAVSRIQAAYDRLGKRFFARYLSDEEIATIGRIHTAAGLWAAKEAVAKALGCGIGKELSFHDMRIVKDDRGAPEVRFSDESASRHAVKACSLSISHDGDFAIAVAIIHTAKERSCIQ